MEHCVSRLRGPLLALAALVKSVACCLDHQFLWFEFCSYHLYVIGHEFDDLNPNFTRPPLDLVCKVLNIVLRFVNEIVDVIGVFCYCCNNFFQTSVIDTVPKPMQYLFTNSQS